MRVVVYIHGIPTQYVGGSVLVVVVIITACKSKGNVSLVKHHRDYLFVGSSPFVVYKEELRQRTVY